MIEALMYGFTPRAMTEKDEKPPPENRSSSWRKPPDEPFNRFARAVLSAPGTGTCASPRTITSMIRM